MFPYTVTIVTAELGSDLRWAYLHPSARRLQLSPTPMHILTKWDALVAFDRAIMFYADGDYPALVTVSGPDGFFRSSYMGPRHGSEQLERKLSQQLHPSTSH